MRFSKSFLLILTLLPTFAVSSEYDIKRNPDGPFSFTISGIKLNEGSTLKRESILFNDPSCPVVLTSHSTNIAFKDRGFRFNGTTNLEVKKDIQAIQVRTIQYDVYGLHMQNLSNDKPADFAVGPKTISGEWRARENNIGELLTTVTYVARVRLADGTQWVFNTDNLQLALSSLNLENKIEDSLGDNVQP